MTAVRRIFAVAALAFAVWGPVVPSAAMADRVGVVGGVHDGYGRIVFNWEAPVRYEARIDGRRLDIKFGRRLDATYDELLRVLRRYVDKVSEGSNGRSVSFELKGDYILRNFDLGTAVVIDLLNRMPKPTAAPAKSAPAAASTAAAGGKAAGEPSVAVRTGEHKGFSRLVFDWPERVGYRVTRDGNRATITFDHPARVDLSGLRTDRPRYLRNARATTSDSAARVVLTMADGAGLRDFRSGNRVGLDITAPPPRTPPSAPAEAGVEVPSPTTGPATAPATGAAPETAEAGPRTETPSGLPAPRGFTSERPAPSGTDTASLSPPTPLIPSRPRALTPPNRPEPPGAGRNGRPAALPTTPAPVDTQAVPAPKPPSVGVESVTMRFDWPEQTGAAVFRRGGAVWAVFDRPSEQDIKALTAAGGNVVPDVAQLRNPRYTVMRFKPTVAAINPVVRRDGLAWILEFRKSPNQPTTPIVVRAQAQSPVGPRIIMPVVEPSQPLVVTDPDVGDNLIIVPVVPLGQGIGGLRQYPQFDLLPTVQGVAIQSRIEGLRVSAHQQGIEVTSQKGLLISNVSPDDEAAARLAAVPPRSRAIEVGTWSFATVPDYLATLQSLQLAAATAKPKNRELTRMELARFYLAHGFAAETLGVLDEIARDRPAIAKEPEFRAMKGMADLLMGRLDDAAAELDDPSLDGIDEGRFLRAAVRAAKRQYGAAEEGFKKSAGILQPYPEVVKMPLGILDAESAVASGDVKRATTLLEALKASGPTPAETSHLKLIAGRLKQISGQPDAAVALWEDVESKPYEPSRTKAVVARTELLLKEKKIDLKTAIDNLEHQRFAWRGGEFEFDLLRRLGDLYLQAGDYRNGLRTLRQAATNFRDNEQAPAVTQEMSDVFAKLFLEGKADSMAPVAAIALYDEFRELTPPGDRGDEMIRRLADRMVSVDLLGEAAKLLDAQVRYRLHGVQQAKIGARLALVYMLDRRPKDALDTLDISNQPDLPADLASQRRHLRARALSDLDRNDAALALLDGDDSHEALTLRAEILWKASEWKQAAQAFGVLVRNSGAVSEAEAGSGLTDKQQNYILNLAVALTLSGNEEGVGALRKQFRASMDKGPYRDAFRLIADPRAKGLLDYHAVASQVNEVKSFQEFLAGYRSMLHSRKLSAIN